MPEVIDLEARSRLNSFEASFGDLRTEFDDYRQEFRDFRDKEFRDHDRADEKREQTVMVELGKIGKSLEVLTSDVRKIDGRQWEETTANRHLREITPMSKRVKMSPEVRQGGIFTVLVAAVIALTEAVKALVHPAPPPPPTTTEIAVEVAKALTGHVPAPSPKP